MVITLLVIFGIMFIGLAMVVVGISVLKESDQDLLDAHPPDPDHIQWPEDGEDI